MAQGFERQFSAEIAAQGCSEMQLFAGIVAQIVAHMFAGSFVQIIPLEVMHYTQIYSQPLSNTQVLETP